ncbi:MAG: glycosyltransferase family 4 protein [Bacteroidales bacterium]|nr:glycosyltransferase family 4 protein [Bacteroidales bacterium]
MKVLFVSSGNNKTGISPIIRNQGFAIEKAGCLIDFYLVKGNGIAGYLKNVLPLRKLLLKENYDIIHAHYSLSAFVASMAFARPLVVSIMGSDIKMEGYLKILLKFFLVTFSWKKIIVKSEDLKRSMNLNKEVIVLPNGVDLDLFIPLNKEYCLNKLGWNINKTHILFAANPKRKEKNFPLFKSSMLLLNIDSVVFHYLEDTPNELMPILYNAASISVLTSLWEGSPNVVKEAMACNCPVVATDVGDIRWLFGDEPGHYIAGFSTEDFADKIKSALEFSNKIGRTNGRERIISLGLDSKVVAKRILEVYHKVMNT